MEKIWKKFFLLVHSSLFFIEICLADSKVSETMAKNFEYVKGFVNELDNPAQVAAKLKTVYPGVLENLFETLEASDFPDKPDWNPDEEFELFKSVMLSENNVAEKSKYIEIMLKKVNISKLSELDDIFLMSESLEFIIDYYKKAEKVAEMSSNFAKLVDTAQDKVQILLDIRNEIVSIGTKMCEDGDNNYKRFKSGEIQLQQFVQAELERSLQMDRMKKLEQEEAEIYAKADLQIVSIAPFYTNVTQELNNILEMEKLWGRHVMHFKTKHELTALTIPPISEHHPIDLEIWEQLANLFQKVEGLRNLILLETNTGKKAELENDLFQNEEGLKNYLDQTTTSEQILAIVPSTNEFLAMVPGKMDIEYVHLDGGMLSNMNKYKQLKAQQKQLDKKYITILQRNKKILPLFDGNGVKDAHKRDEL